ncbi:conserved hypothetical protein [Roseibium sp. TrichSKD4]|nr:conserved hypothetical protein [Roseibium sp. TrichSKD4]
MNAGQAFGGINPNTNAGLTKLANIINQATGGKIKLVEAGGIDTREGGSRIYVKDGKIQSVQIWGNQALSQKLTQKLQGTTIYSGNNIPQDDTPLGMVHNAGQGNYGSVSVVGSNNGGGWGKPVPLPGKPTVCPMPKPMPVPYNGGGMQVAQGGQVAGAGHVHAGGNVLAGGHVHAAQGAGQAAGGHAGHAHHAEKNDGNVGGILGGIFGLKSGLLGGLANLFSKKSGILGAVGGLAAPVLGIFSKLVGHDGAHKAAMNGDLGGWLVNTFDHTSHSHALGGNEGNGNGGLLGITNIAGTLGQEAGHILGLDKVFGDAKQYDAQNGTDYAKGGGEPKHFL